MQRLPPGYFALVMATGIISLGLELEGFHVFSTVLLAIAAVAYAVLLVLTLWRAFWFPRDVVADFSGPRNGFSFFTFVAGTNVLGARLAAAGVPVLPFVLLGLSFLAWLVLGYVIPGLVVGRNQGDDILAGLNGTWFIWSVASQSVAVLAASLEPTAGAFSNGLSIIAVLSWGIGVILYAVIGCALIIRVLTRGIPVEEMGPPYWVTMGAGAITVLAGSRIVEMSDTAMVSVMRAPVAAAAVVFWAFATWLIPALVGIGIWRHFIHEVPLRYEAAMWSMVFPLGMYAVAGIYLGRADNLPIVGWIGGRFLWVAVAVWAVVLVTMCVGIVKGLRGRPAAPAQSGRSA
ncbi:tellurite resistance/C4-dicarboxylate transporter family protein [Tessaracoccus terricola]